MPQSRSDVFRLALGHGRMVAGLALALLLTGCTRGPDRAETLYPEMADAHWLLANLYRITGEGEKQRMELAEVQRLNNLFPPGTQTPPAMQDLLFSVRKPGLAVGQGSVATPKR